MIIRGLKIDLTQTLENLPSPLFALQARLRPGRAHAPEGGPMGRRPKRGNSSLWKKMEIMSPW